MRVAPLAIMQSADVELLRFPRLVAPHFSTFGKSVFPCLLDTAIGNPLFAALGVYLRVTFYPLPFS